MTVSIRVATIKDADVVAHCVLALLTELVPEKRFDSDEMISITASLLADTASFAALLAYDGDDCVGCITVTRCVAIYAKGEFGEIAELYVTPDHRSRKVGQALIAASLDYARNRGWQRLEVCAPPQPEWARSVAFYERNGFTEIGPRLKCLVENT